MFCRILPLLMERKGELKSKKLRVFSLVVSVWLRAILCDGQRAVGVQEAADA